MTATSTKARQRAVAFTGSRPLSDVLEHNRVMRVARAASLAEEAANCLYAVENGSVIEIPIDRRTPKQIKFRYASDVSDRLTEHTVSREQIERDGFTWYGYLPDSIAGHCLYATPGLAEALLGEGLPPLNVPDWRDEADKARDHRAVMRACYRMDHEHVDQLRHAWWHEFITSEEAAVIHARIDAAVKAAGYWDDDLPAEWWRSA